MNLVSMLKLFCLLSTMKNALRSCFIYYSADNEAEARIQRGALTLASAEVKFQIDTETHDPLDIGMYQIREANQMVEEFMLAANVSVAEKEFPECSLLR
ncbi:RIBONUCLEASE [Salix viminalis]|uniref:RIBONUCLEASE n=1 Tax=Salix viminalis TaxID=40686 RepID=A0A9Q0NH81_SALVM|nr:RIBONUCLEASE [Salix viminalis]